MRTMVWKLNRTRIVHIWARYKALCIAGCAVLLLAMGGSLAFITSSLSRNETPAATSAKRTDAPTNTNEDLVANSDVAGLATDTTNTETTAEDANATTTPAPPPTPSPSPASTRPSQSQPYAIFGEINVELPLGGTKQASFATSQDPPVAVAWSGTIPGDSQSKIAATLPSLPSSIDYLATFTALPAAQAGDSFTYTLIAGSVQQPITVKIVEATAP